MMCYNLLKDNIRGRGHAPRFSHRSDLVRAANPLRFFIMRTPTGIPANESVFKFDIHAVGLTTRKRRGEAAEAAFLAKASGLGFGVAKPWGDSERYDFLLDSGHGEQLSVRCAVCPLCPLPTSFHLVIPNPLQR